MIELSRKQEFLAGILNAAAADPGLKQKLIRNPKEVIESRLNFKLPEDFKVVVHEDTPTKLNIVLPVQSEELSDIELSAVSGGVDWGCTDQGPCSYNVPSDIKLKDNITDL